MENGLQSITETGFMRQYVTGEGLLRLECVIPVSLHTSELATLYAIEADMRSGVNVMGRYYEFLGPLRQFERGYQQKADSLAFFRSHARAAGFTLELQGDHDLHTLRDAWWSNKVADGKFTPEMCRSGERFLKLLRNSWESLQLAAVRRGAAAFFADSACLGSLYARYLGLSQSFACRAGVDDSALKLDLSALVPGGDPLSFIDGLDNPVRLYRASEDRYVFVTENTRRTPSLISQRFGSDIDLKPEHIKGYVTTYQMKDGGAATALVPHPFMWSRDIDFISEYLNSLDDIDMAVQQRIKEDVFGIFEPVRNEVRIIPM